MVGDPPRDEMGLEPIGPNTKPELKARNFYYNLLGKLIFVQAPIMALALLWIVRLVFPRVAEVQNDHVEFLGRHDLGWAYAAWYLLFLTKVYHNINANGARAGARVGRPDQHAYRIMTASHKQDGDDDGKKSEQSLLADAPYVLMENDGPVGRFNRAQRAAFHMDEGSAFGVVTAALLSGAIVPRVVFVLAAVYMFGRIRFANEYTASLGGRLKALLMYAIPEHLMIAMVGIFGLQAILFGFFDE